VVSTSGVSGSCSVVPIDNIPVYNGVLSVFRLSLSLFLFLPFAFFISSFPSFLLYLLVFFFPTLLSFLYSCSRITVSFFIPFAFLPYSILSSSSAASIKTVAVKRVSVKLSRWGIHSSQYLCLHGTTLKRRLFFYWLCSENALIRGHSTRSRCNSIRRDLTVS
jgi:hypothetical protein